MIYDLSFNICFIGTYSFTQNAWVIPTYLLHVLILVLLELILLLVMHTKNSSSNSMF